MNEAEKEAREHKELNGFLKDLHLHIKDASDAGYICSLIRQKVEMDTTKALQKAEKRGRDEKDMEIGDRLLAAGKLVHKDLLESCKENYKNGLLRGGGEA